MTSIYTAIMKAADRVEADKKRYSFHSCEVPSACRGTGCMWGWIGFYLGLPAGTCNGDVARACGVGNNTGHLYEFAANYLVFRSLMSPKGVAKAMRAYAKKYHALPVQQPPDWQKLAAVQTVPETARSQELA